MLHPEAKFFIEHRMQDVARERGEPFQPERDDNEHGLKMGVLQRRAHRVAAAGRDAPAARARDRGDQPMCMLPPEPAAHLRTGFLRVVSARVHRRLDNTKIVRLSKRDEVGAIRADLVHGLPACAGRAGRAFLRACPGRTTR